MKVYKTILRVTIYSQDPSPVESAGLEELGRAIDTGDDIGDVVVLSRRTLTDPKQIRSELLSIGNDGMFFQPDEDEEDADDEGTVTGR